MKQELPVLIVGNGLAGTMLHYFFNKHGICAERAGRIKDGAASPAAYGIINPIHIRTATPAWNAAHVVPFALEVYSEIQAFLSERFFHPTHILHFYRDAADKQLWELNYESTDTFRWAKPGNDQVRIEPAAYINTPLFVNLLSESALPCLDQWFKYEDLKPIQDGWTYKNKAYSAVFFAEGWRNNENPWFHRLPLKPNKGQVLEINCDATEVEALLHKRGFFWQDKNGRGKVGSTYNNHDLVISPNEADTAELKSMAEELTGDSYSIRNIHVGIRPASGDRRPVLGEHPAYKGLYIFNGLGSRGLSLAPYYANQLATHFINGTRLSAEVDVKRFSRRLNKDAE